MVHLQSTACNAHRSGQQSACADVPVGAGWRPAHSTSRGRFQSRHPAGN